MTQLLSFYNISLFKIKFAFQNLCTQTIGHLFSRYFLWNGVLGIGFSSTKTGTFHYICCHLIQEYKNNILMDARDLPSVPLGVI